MEPGELELRKVFEDVTRQNVQTNIDFSNDTRKLVRELQTEVKALANNVVTQNLIIEELKKQIALLQQKLYSGGTN